MNFQLRFFSLDVKSTENSLEISCLLPKKNKTIYKNEDVHQTEQENGGSLRVSVLAAADAREKGVWRTNDGVCVAISSRGSRLINEQSRASRSCDVCGGGRAAFRGAAFVWLQCERKRSTSGVRVPSLGRVLPMTPQRIKKNIITLTCPGCSPALTPVTVGTVECRRKRV